jgi:hypothetical protein
MSVTGLWATSDADMFAVHKFMRVLQRCYQRIISRTLAHPFALWYTCMKAAACMQVRKLAGAFAHLVVTCFQRSLKLQLTGVGLCIQQQSVAVGAAAALACRRLKQHRQSSSGFAVVHSLCAVVVIQAGLLLCSTWVNVQHFSNTNWQLHVLCMTAAATAHLHSQTYMHSKVM